MIAGLEQVINDRDAAVGRFYIRHTGDGTNVLFQCISIKYANEDKPRICALRFGTKSNSAINIGQTDDREPVVELPEVLIRVDPRSTTSSSPYSSPQAGMFLVAGKDACYVVGDQFGGSWQVINLCSGHRVEAKSLGDWVAFSRWKLVVKDDERERTLASFGWAEDEEN